MDNDRNVRELVEELHMSERTAYRHNISIYEKTGVSSRLGLSLMCYGNYKKESLYQQLQEDEPPG